MQTIRVLVLLVVAVHLSACAALRGRDPAACGVIGSVLGGTGGAFAGAAINDDGNDIGPATAGGVIGFAVGALAGYYLCKEPEKEPPPKKAPPPPAPTPEPTPVPEPEVKEKIILRGVNFDFDKASIRPDAAVILEEAARILNENPEVEVRVEGYTDSTGPEEYNQGLSERRAASVRQYLVDQGVGAERLTTAGFGESNPIASNETREGRALNRRVELQVSD